MLKYLIFLVIVLIVIAIMQAMRVFELASELRGGKDDQRVTLKDNRVNASLMLLFLFVYFGFIIYQMVAWGKLLLPEASSEHGIEIDNMMNVNLWVIGIVFVITHILLFYFAFRYYGRNDRKAKYYPENNKLEVVWTVIPSIVLAGLITYGLTVWGNVMSPEYEVQPDKIEVYSKQFDWTVRYPGNDGNFGPANYNLISGTNVMGIATKETVNQTLSKVQDDIISLKKRKKELFFEENMEVVQDDIDKKERRIKRILTFKDTLDTRPGALEWGADDKITRELHLVVNKPVTLLFNSRDVIHSAYLPHFRVQMNTVPGMTTQFTFTPTKTTEKMKQLEGEDFEYVLLCNKICGAGHWNMQLKVIVETQEEYDNWLKEQPGFEQSEEASPIEETAPQDTVVTDTTAMAVDQLPETR